MKLLVYPMPLTYPFTQLPSWSRNTPPPPAFPGLFKAEPSEFSFNQPHGGFSHPTGMIDLTGLLLASSPIAKNSVLYLKHFFQHWLSTVPVVKIKLFLCNHSCHSPKGKIILQGMPFTEAFIGSLQLVSNHSLKGRPNEFLVQIGACSCCQKLWAKSQPLKRFSIDSFFLLQILHTGSRIKPLEPKTSAVSRLPCKQSHRKNWTLGGISVFHTQLNDIVFRFKGFNPLAMR